MRRFDYEQLIPSVFLAVIGCVMICAVAFPYNQPPVTVLCETPGTNSCYVFQPQDHYFTDSGAIVITDEHNKKTILSNMSCIVAPRDEIDLGACNE